MAMLLSEIPFAIPAPISGRPIPRIGPESAGILMTPEEFDAIDEIIVNEQGIYTTTLLPGFELKLAEILGEADKWS